MVAIQIRLRIFLRALMSKGQSRRGRVVTGLSLLLSSAACATESPGQLPAPLVEPVAASTITMPALAAARPTPAGDNPVLTARQLARIAGAGSAAETAAGRSLEGRATTVAVTTSTGAVSNLSTAAPGTTVMRADRTAADATDCVVLLHGLARTTKSMRTLQTFLESRGYAVANTGYPSRDTTVAELAMEALPRALSTCDSLWAKQPSAMQASAAATANPTVNPAANPAVNPSTAITDSGRVHFVTHSMGGILLRYYLSQRDIPSLGRVVMLAPPNQGSQVVDKFGPLPGFRLLNGPAGLQLGTRADSVPRQLGGVSFDLGVIAGTSSINLILSQVLPNPDDGKVSVANTRLDGMCAHLALSVSHPFIMQRQFVLDEVVHYLDTGRFLSDHAEYPDCPARSTR